MSIRKSEFEKAWNKARSDKNIEIRMKKMNDVGIEYLQKEYSDAALRIIEKTVIEKYEGRKSPTELHELFLEVAKHYSKTGNYDRAEQILHSILDSRNVQVLIKARYEANLIRLRRGLSLGGAREDVFDEIKAIIASDEEHEIDTADDQRSLGINFGSQDNVSVSNAQIEDNQAFLDEISRTSGQSILPEVVTRLTQRADYSFRELYNEKLKDEIFARLEILGVPEEKRETEAQKVFLYMKMMKKVKLINSGMVTGSTLDDILDDSVIEYRDALNFVGLHTNEGLSYDKLKEALEANKFERISWDLETNFQNDTTSKQESDNLAEDERTTDSLFGNAVNRQAEEKILDATNKYLELLTTLKGLDAEELRVDQEILLEKAIEQEEVR